MWSPLETGRDHFVKSQARQLVGECESFLAGDLPSALQNRGLPVPEWAWLSMLAHAPTEVVVRYATGGPGGRFRGHLNSVWLGAVALLAREVVIVAGRTGCSVEELQHEVFLDLELNWRRVMSGGPATGPRRFVDEVRKALHRFRNSPHTR